MDKFHRLSTFVTLTISLTITLDLSLAFAQAQETQLTWGNIIQRVFRRDKPPLGGRGDACPIAPLKQEHQIPAPVWNDRPLFVWRGNIAAIGVRPANGNTVTWQQPVSSSNSLNRLRYSGTAKLQPGQTYDLLFFMSTESQSPQFWIPFQVIPAPDRIRVETDLLTLQRKLDNQQATPEVTALQRANYFAQRQLWSDVLQEVYSVKNPSPDLQQAAQAIENQICQSKETAIDGTLKAR